jgi:hypothetical protein
MKQILTFLLLLIAGNAIAQSFDCAIARIGKFELNSPTSGKTVIIRTLTSQLEINDSLNLEASYDLIWIDSCTYELKNKKLIKGDVRYEGLPTDTLKVEILKIVGTKIFVRSSSNYSDRITERELIKIE